MYAVFGNGQFRRATPPTHSGDNWASRSTLIGTGGWQNFKFLFFDPNGMLYALPVSKGNLLTGSPPVSGSGHSDSWCAKANVIGLGGWNTFSFLFFNSKMEEIETLL